MGGPERRGFQKLFSPRQAPTSWYTEPEQYRMEIMTLETYLHVLHLHKSRPPGTVAHLIFF